MNLYDRVNVARERILDAVTAGEWPVAVQDGTAETIALVELENEGRITVRRNYEVGLA